MRIQLKLLIIIFLTSLSSFESSGQIDEKQNGAWYMYFWNTRFQDGPFGMQGDIQFRNWDMGGDLEQLLIRAGFNYEPIPKQIRLTLGYASITSGEFGESNRTSSEDRIYQEALLWQTIGGRFYLNHRFRFEQRFVENQDTRTRFRYFLSMNIPLNTDKIEPGTYYLSFYDELFINGQQDIGDSVVPFFDRNRLYGALGYAIKSSMKVQIGIMRQSLSSSNKNQWQFGLFHSF